MIEAYILVVFMGYARAVEMQEFSSKATCESALSAIMQQPSGHPSWNMTWKEHLNAFCIKK